jgi:hypothetical protein
MLYTSSHIAAVGTAQLCRSPGHHVGCPIFGSTLTSNLMCIQASKALCQHITRLTSLAPGSHRMVSLHLGQDGKAGRLQSCHQDACKPQILCSTRRVHSDAYRPRSTHCGAILQGAGDLTNDCEIADVHKADACPNRDLCCYCHPKQCSEDCQKDTRWHCCRPLLEALKLAKALAPFDSPASSRCCPINVIVRL